MKVLIILLVSMVFNLNSAFASLQFEKANEDAVSATVVEGFLVTSSKDKKLSAKLLTEYSGGAAGMLTTYITFLDQGPTEGDYQNANTYKLSYVKTLPKDVKLEKISKNRYRLFFNVYEVNSNKEGDFIYPLVSVTIDVILDENGSLVSATKQ